MKKFIALVVVVAVGFGIYKLALGGPYQAGKRAFASEDYDRAAASFQQAFEEGKNRYESLVYLARIDGINEDYEEGISKCDQAIESKPKEAVAYYYKAVLLQLAGKMFEAEEVLDKLSEIPQIGKGIHIANITNPRPAGGDLRPEEIAWRVDVLKGKAY